MAQANRYFAGEEPWVKRKSDPARMATILYVTAEVLRVVAIFAQPFMPVRMGKLLDLLGVAADARDFRMVGETLGSGQIWPCRPCSDLPALRGARAEAARAGSDVLRLAANVLHADRLALPSRLSRLRRGPRRGDRTRQSALASAA